MCQVSATLPEVAKEHSSASAILKWPLKAISSSDGLDLQMETMTAKWKVVKRCSSSRDPVCPRKP